MDDTGGSFNLHTSPWLHTFSESWDTADAEGEAKVIFITAGVGTEMRPR